MACVIVALICMLYMLRAKRFDGVDIGPFISGAMVRDDHRIGLTLLVAETVYDMQVQLRREIEYDSRVLFLAYVATGAAAIALLANAVTVYPSNPSIHAPANAGTPVTESEDLTAMSNESFADQQPAAVVPRDERAPVCEGLPSR